MTSRAAATQFWQWFSLQAQAFLPLPSSEIIDDLAEQLASVDAALAPELSSPGAGATRELIITAHGDQSRFPLIRDLVAQAPDLPGWQIQAFKPPRGFDFQVSGLPGLSLSNWRFVPLKSSPEFTELGLQLELPEQDREKLDTETLTRIIEEGVGEVLASCCTHLQTTSTPTPGALPLQLLAETLSAWAIARGPAAIQPFLPAVDFTDHNSDNRA